MSARQSRQEKKKERQYMDGKRIVAIEGGRGDEDDFQWYN
jgi:hypothetical protein